VQAATIALNAKAKRLIIGHFSSKYTELEPFLEESRPVFPNTDLAIEGATYIV
jgi:ribonuclease Z